MALIEALDEEEDGDSISSDKHFTFREFSMPIFGSIMFIYGMFKP